MACQFYQSWRKTPSVHGGDISRLRSNPVSDVCFLLLNVFNDFKWHTAAAIKDGFSEYIASVFSHKLEYN
jgi:hypothetical protein